MTTRDDDRLKRKTERFVRQPVSIVLDGHKLVGFSDTTKIEADGNMTLIFEITVRRGSSTYEYVRRLIREAGRVGADKETT